MQQASQIVSAQSGREASRQRRAQLVQGKSALPTASERTRIGERSAQVVAISTAPSNKQQHPTSAAPKQTTSSPAPQTSQAAPVASTPALTGREASRARRAKLIQGKGALQKKTPTSTAVTAVGGHTNTVATGVNTQTGTKDVSQAPVVACGGRLAAQAMRNARARNGRGDQQASRPSGRMRSGQPISYPPKVAESKSYADRKISGVRIGRGVNVTGDEPGAGLQVTGSQYIGKETGFQPREGGTGIKVGASRTTGGQVVTGTQVRSKIRITGDESNPALRISGESDQEIDDDLLQRREQGAYAQMQFQRQNDPHGRSVFGANLGRSIKSVGSRQRERAYQMEESLGGHVISGTAVGRSANTTGDEPGSCRHITGDQYLIPAAKQPMCNIDETSNSAQRKFQRGMMKGIASAQFTAEASTWEGQRVTGVDVEHNPRVTGDEPGVCSPITGTPYAGPNQYEDFCAEGVSENASQRLATQYAPGNRITGDTPLNVGSVTGTQRGGERDITGTPYYRADQEDNTDMNLIAHIQNINNRFSIRSPQRDSQINAGTEAVNLPTASSRITGTFRAGEGKITGNQEFHFNPRPKVERVEDKSRITGEGRIEGPTITGSAWDSKDNVTGTEGYIAAERNPSQREGRSHAFAGAGMFKGKGNHTAPTHHVTGMVGWTAKSAARVTMSGGAQG